MISTPDHWHVPMALAAVKAGKDVALEKPITRYINEGRLLADLVRRHKRVFRVDSEFRSLEPMHRAAELVRNGRIGKLHTIRTGSPREVFPDEPETVTPPPADSTTTSGSARRPRCPTSRSASTRRSDLKSRPGWMRNLDYCDGMITNWGTHLNDIAQWGNDTERTGPVEIKATRQVPRRQSLERAARSFDAWYRFANGMELFYQMGTAACALRGREGLDPGQLLQDKLHPDRLQASDPAILKEKIGPEEIHFPLRSEKTDFIESVKTRAARRSKTPRSATAPPRSATWPTSPSSWAAASCAGTPTGNVHGQRRRQQAAQPPGLARPLETGMNYAYPVACQSSGQAPAAPHARAMYQPCPSQVQA